MARARRRTDPAVDEQLFSEGFNFEFFQAVRLLGRLFPERKPVGTSARPSEEIVRFASWHSLAFPASPVEFVAEPRTPGEQPSMTVTFLALTGTQGVLPLYFTERLLAADVARQETVGAFLDLFHHRLISFFYRAWQKYCAPALREAAPIGQPEEDELQEQQHPPDAFTQALFDFCGLGTKGLCNRLAVADQSILVYVGLIGQRPLSACSLGAILSDRFQLDVFVRQFVGSWSNLEQGDRSYLSRESESNQLGVAAFLGDRIWDQQARICLRLGPLTRARFQSFLPGGESMREFVSVVRFLVGRSMAFDVQLVLKANEVPELYLFDSTPAAPRLGWSSWLKTRPFTENAPDAVFTYAS